MPGGTSSVTGSHRDIRSFAEGGNNSGHSRDPTQFNQQQVFVGSGYLEGIDPFVFQNGTVNDGATSFLSEAQATTRLTAPAATTP